MKGITVSALLVGLLLAGCADHAAKSSTATADPAAHFDVEVQASKTTGVIRGVVFDASIKPLAGANVTLAPGDKTTRTTENGAFGFSDLDPGTYFLRVAKIGYNETQVSAEVVAGVDEPAFVKVLMQVNADTTPFYSVVDLDGFMTCGVAVVASSVGCDTSTDQQFGDRVYFLVTFDALPQWSQGELVWKQTQPAGGEFIWQIAKPGTNNYYTAGQTTTSPALAVMNTTLLKDNEKLILSDGAEYRVFGGPHPLCTAAPPPSPVPYLWPYGCGVTLNQAFHIYIHTFYNFVPAEGWRFTNDGDPVIPN